MQGLDTLLLRAVLHSIQEELDEDQIRHIEEKLQQEYGLAFHELFNKFDKVRNTLYQFENDLKNIEDKILRNFLSVGKDPDSSDVWLIIRNKHLAELILKTFADEDKKMILDLTREKTETVPNLLSRCHLPNTSGYRKTKQLIDDGFIIPVGLAESFEGKRAILYKSVIQKIQITINRDQVITSILIPKEEMISSHIINTILDINQNNVKSLSN